MVKIRLATNDDKDEWNRVVSESPEGVYNCVYEWKEIVEKGLSIESPFVLAENKGEVIGVYPAFIVPLFRANKVHTFLPKLSNAVRIMQTPFPDAWYYCSPYTVPGTNKTVLKDMINYVELVTKSKNALSNNIMPYIGHAQKESDLSNILTYRDYHLNGFFYSQVIDLSRNIEDIQKDIKKNVRQDIKKAEEKGIYVMESTDITGLNELYKVILNMQKRTGIYMPPYSLYKSALEILGPKKLMKIHLAKHEGKIIGASYRTYFKDLVCIASEATSPEFNQLHPSHALYWNCIKESKEEDYKNFDTCGLPHDKNSGLYFFKSRWGGEIRKVYKYIKIIKPTRKAIACRKILSGCSRFV